MGSEMCIRDRVNELTGGASLAANVEIIRNNARVAAVIAREYHAL